MGWTQQQDAPRRAAVKKTWNLQLISETVSKMEEQREEMQMRGDKRMVLKPRGMLTTVC